MHLFMIDIRTPAGTHSCLAPVRSTAQSLPLSFSLANIYSIYSVDIAIGIGIGIVGQTRPRPIPDHGNRHVSAICWRNRKQMHSRCISGALVGDGRTAVGRSRVALDCLRLGRVCLDNRKCAMKMVFSLLIYA